MPIYEFYCPDCHTVFNFFSSRIDLEASPACPGCGRPRLGRKPSTFATLRASSGEAGQEGGDDPMAGMDEERLEGAMESVFGGLDEGAEEDPRRMARLLRRFGDAAGLEPGPRMEEMLHRLEAGEDPDALESEMGDDAEGEEGFEDFFRLKKVARGRRGRPRVDKELYFL